MYDPQHEDGVQSLGTVIRGYNATASNITDAYAGVLPTRTTTSYDDADHHHDDYDARHGGHHEEIEGVRQTPERGRQERGAHVGRPLFAYESGGGVVNADGDLRVAMKDTSPDRCSFGMRRNENK